MISSWLGNDDSCLTHGCFCRRDLHPHRRQLILLRRKRMTKTRKSQSGASKKKPHGEPLQASVPVITPPTSNVDGGVPSAPKAARLSGRDKANAQAPQHAINVLHLWCQARLATALTARGSDLALARARPAMKRQASSDQRPPTSHVSTTRRVRPCSPVSSGLVSSLRRRTCVNVAPSTASLWRRGLPSPRNADTIVVFTANCATPQH